ncbi:MAG TPA: CIA30 family protein [Vicinamibacteria bacterium]|nr:CIA30 family protein [Vicinamibacteria bacterium]
MRNATKGRVRDLGVRLVLAMATVALAAAAPPAPKKATTAAIAAAPGSALARYRDPALSVEDRVADLLPRMTLEEKVAEVSTAEAYGGEVLDPTGTFTTAQAREVMARWWDPDVVLPGRRAAILRNAVQRYLREKTRLGIPMLFQGEALHGFMEYGSTSFPQALALAATWDPRLVHEVFTAAGDEARSAGVGQVFTPVLDLARDPRWGRTEETYGEDPYLVSRLAVAAVTGLQGDTFGLDHHHVLATMKHFAVHGQPEGGTNTAPGNYSERVLRETFLVPFEAAVKEARVASAMASYNEIDGVPSHANRWLLERVLRQEWGFPGFVVSDANGLQMLVDTHRVAATKADAARLGLAAGVDYDLSDGSVYRTLLLQVKQGIVAESQLDRAVGRMLAAKFRLGLFDDPYVDPAYAERTTNGPERRKLAQKTAEKAIVLLKNENGLLPLDLANLKTIAVIGPNADGLHLGGYSRGPAHGVTLLQGIRDRVGGRAMVEYAEGCRFTSARQDWHGWFDDDVKLVDPATQQEKVKAAAELARRSDVAIVVVGENESSNREAWSEQHLGDRDSLDLLGAQEELVEAVAATGKPTVVFLLNGRPLSINWIAGHVGAVLEGFYLGQEGGTAAAAVLFGDVNPGGKLPITFPRSVGDLPAFYNHKPSANRTYAFSTRQPLFPFGYGLSYTTFKFENLRVEPKQIALGGTAKVSVEVTNTGARAGDEVAQLYVHQRVASVTRPVLQLRGFERVTLAPGERRTVTFTVSPDALSLVGLDMRPVVEPGIFDLMVGPSSDRTDTVPLAVVGPYGETGIPPLPPPPPGSESGLVSDFEGATVSARYGSWRAISDSEGGGKSTVSMQVVPGGAEGSKGSLRVSGEVVPGGQFPFAGVLFAPGASRNDAVNLSGKKTVSFWAKGDGKTYVVALTSESGQGQMPPMQPFVAGPEWKPYSFPLSVFRTDGHDVTGLGFVQGQTPGRFELELDQVEIR